MPREEKFQSNAFGAEQRSCLIATLGLLLFSLACAAWRLSSFGPGFPGSESYSTIALQVLDTGAFQTAFRPPIYPLFLAVMMYLFGEQWETAAVIVQAILSAGVGVLIYRFAARLAHSERAGIVAALLYVSNALYQFEATAKRETTLFTLFFLLFFWAALFIRKPSTKYIVLALTAALALLLRPNAVALLPVGAVILFLDIRKGGFSPTVLLFPILLFLALIVPWQLFVRGVTGSYPLTTSANSGQVLWKGNHEHLLAVWPSADIDLIEGEMTKGIGGVNITTAEGDRLLKEQAVAFIKAQPVLALRLAAAKAALFFAPFPIPYGDGELVYHNGTPSFTEFRYRNKLLLAGSTLHSIILIFGAFGFMATAWRGSEEQRLAATMAIIVTLVLLAVHTLSYPESRYRWPLDILWTVIAAEFLARRFWSRSP